MIFLFTCKEGLSSGGPLDLSRRLNRPLPESNGLKSTIDRSRRSAWLEMHESGTYVKFTQAGAEMFA